jgi:hypothetical protein
MHVFVIIVSGFVTAILQKAIDHFPNNTVPKDRDERIEIVEQIEGVADEVWGDLDQKLYEYEVDLKL